MYINNQCEKLMLKLTSIVQCTYNDRKTKSATCFFCQTNSSRIILITNKHVFENCITATLYITIHNRHNNLKEVIPLTLRLGTDIKFHGNYDICTLDITNIYIDLENKGLIPELTFLNENGILTDYSNLHILQEIIMLGYPSGIINIHNNHPIIRTGITATSINGKYNNQEIFLTDIPTFGGSSGSPILITNDDGTLFLIGINSETFNQVTPIYSPKRLYQKSKIVGYVEIPNDIGIAINSRVIKEMLNNY